MSSPLSKLPPRFQAPVKAAFRALTAPPDIKSEEIEAQAVAPISGDALEKRMHKPIVIGGVTIGVFVVFAAILANFIKIDGAVMSQGAVRAEYNRRTLRQRDGGVVSAIYVREGQRVKQGQVLLQFTPTQPEAAVDVMRNQTDSAQVQSARYESEMLGRDAILYPPGLAQRAKTDAALANLMRDQQFVFDNRRALANNQRAIFQQQIQQLKARIGGLNLQIQANEQSAGLIREQLNGYQTLYDKGFAPRNLLLNLQRTLSDLGGQRGANIAEVTRTQEQIGEVTGNLVKLNQQMQTEAAEGLRDSQVRLADALPRLRSAEESLTGATVRSPVDGYVYGLTQFTVGSAAGAGERLMDIVPANEPLIIEAHIKPTDIDQATIGQKARVMLSAYNSRTHSGVDATVVGVSADMIQPETAPPYFRAEVRIKPEDLIKSHNQDVKLTPGMPATVMLLTGKRSIMDYLLGPFVKPLEKALRED